MQNNILTKGMGEIAKISVDSIYGYEAFASKFNKKVYIHLLKEAMNESVCLIAYCVLDRSAYFVVKGENKQAVNEYAKTVNYAFAANFDAGKIKMGSPLRSDFSYEKIKSDDLDDVVKFVHSMAPNNAPENYKYCSFNYLLEGSSGGTRIIINEMGGNITKADYVMWLSSSVRNTYAVGSSGKEKFKKVLRESCKQYIEPCTVRSESVILFVIADTAIRTGTSYKKIIKRMGISYKNRRDLMIGAMCEMIENRGYSFDDAYNTLMLNKESYDTLMVETMVEMNRLKGFSYDYITAKMGYMDYNYDVLVNILCGLHAKFQYNFEEMCNRFHLQNDIISIRGRCGF